MRLPPGRHRAPARAVLLGLALTASLAPPAARAEDRTGSPQARLEASRRAAGTAVTRRILALGDLTALSGTALHLTDAHRRTLGSQLSAQVDGLTVLGARIGGDSDAAAVRSDALKVINDYRVYVLTVPRTRALIVADVELAAVAWLTNVADRLGAAADRVAGKDMTGARADLAALRAKLTAVTAGVVPLPAALLALEPSGYPGNRPTLDAARAALATGRADLGDAAALARSVLADLK